MKTSLFVVLAVLMALVVPCKAGSDCEGCDANQKKPAQKVSLKAKKATPQVLVARSQPVAKAGFCRDFYCKHAAGSPWWPGAPGD
jgi:hypothetical protein